MNIQKICFIFIISYNFVYGFGENIQTLQAHFTQQTKSQNNILQYSGIFYAKTPSKAKWLYETPTQKEIYINDSTSIVYEPLLEQATIRNTHHKLDFLHILKQAKLQKDGKYHAIFEKTDYELMLKNEVPYKLEFKDEFENIIIIYFEDVIINQPINDDVFTFVPPAEIDIIQ